MTLLSYNSHSKNFISNNISLIQNCSMYIHIPFCKQKCFYCSFVVSVGKEKKVDCYLDCLFQEVKQYSSLKIKSIYVGGGTPTFLTEEQLERLCVGIKRSFIFDGNIEWTFEANPDGLTDKKIDILKNQGVNRISLGVQSLQNKYLKYLGRTHDQSLVKEALFLLREKNIQNISLDLMFGFPNQSIKELEKDLDGIVRLNSDHISLYALTLEKGSRFHTRSVSLPDEKEQEEQYCFVFNQLEKMGLKQYEISNFAKEGKMSAHNLHYWQGGNYIGLGVGAHSHIDGKRFWNVSRLMEYMKKIQNFESVIEGSEELTVQQRLVESLLFGLRMNAGVNIDSLEKKFSLLLDEEKKNNLQMFVEQGWLEEENKVLRSTIKGRLVLDELCSRLV